MAKKPQATTTVKASNYGANRLKRLLKHLKLHPEDMQAKAALDENKTVSTRKASNSKLGWMSSDKSLDSTLRSKFVGTVTKEAAMAHARFIRFMKKAQFHMMPVLTSVEGKPSLVFKHTSKLSNFSGKGKATEEKAVA